MTLLQLASAIHLRNSDIPQQKALKNIRFSALSLCQLLRGVYAPKSGKATNTSIHSELVLDSLSHPPAIVRFWA
jgi:hypothetical protein